MSAQRQPDAVRAHRSALKTARKAISRWAGMDKERRAALLLLANCGSDRDGDATLDAIASVFEEYTLPEDVVRALDALATKAHRLWQERDDAQFVVGEVVIARESVQGLVKGSKYRIADVEVQRLAFGTFVTYSMRPVGSAADATPFPITNGHQLLDSKEEAAIRSVSEGQSYYLGEDR